MNPEDRKRTTAQEEMILDRLKRGPATNVELIELSHATNFTARISTIRHKMGVNIVLKKRNVGKVAGVNLYEIQPSEPVQSALF